MIALGSAEVGGWIRVGTIVVTCVAGGVIQITGG
jgi:hypothetical protein